MRSATTLIHHRLIAALLALLTAGAAMAQGPQTEAQPVRAAALTGTWHSVAPEAMGNLHALRHFVISSDHWKVRFNAFADAQARQPLFTLEVGGVYTLGGASPTVSGAWEGVFPAQYRRITADSEAGVALFAAMGCTLRAGTPLALVSQSCGFVPSLMTAMGEYDLVAIKDDQLFFGDRSGDLTRSRPNKLTPHPLRRD